MSEQWYRIIKDEEYCSDILDIFCELHDYMITKIIFQYQDSTATVYLRYDTDDEGVVLKFINVTRINICPKDDDDLWLVGATIQLTKEGNFLWYIDDEKWDDDELYQSRGLDWIEAEEIQFAWLDKDNNIIPLSNEKLNPIWSTYNYNTGKYEKVQKNFKVFEV